MKIAICDDEQKDAAYIESILLKCGKRLVTCDCFASGDGLLSYLNKNAERYELYFLDIEMPGQNGIETAKALRKCDTNALIIYVTSHEDYVYDVFETLPFRFLKKPVSKIRIEEIWAEVLDYIHSRKQIFSFVQDRMPYQIYTEEIEFFEINGRIITLHAINQQIYTFYGRIYKVKEELSANLFLHPHSSFIVNADFIATMTNTEILLQDGTSIPITDKYRKAFKEAYFDYVKWRRTK